MTRSSRKGGERLDWQSIHERLARAEAAIADADVLSPERASALMSARARALAKRPDEEVARGEELAVLRFGLGRERYAIETRFVLQVVRISELTRVPGTPDFIAGIVSIRGDVLPIVELRSLFGLEHRGLSDRSRVIVLGMDEAEIGVLADDVDTIDRVGELDLLDPSELAPAISRDYVRGVTADALVVVDGAALLADERLVVDEK